MFSSSDAELSYYIREVPYLTVQTSQIFHPFMATSKLKEASVNF
jgi:hypothetical protein